MITYHSNSLATLDNQAGHNGLGGRISSDRLVSLSARYILTGVQISALPNFNGKGTGRLYYTAGGPANLAWQAPNDSIGANVPVAVDGTYTLISGNGVKLVVDVDVSALPAASSSPFVNLDIIKNTLFTDITIAQAMAGHVDYRCLFLKNDDIFAYTSVRPRFRRVASILTKEYPVFGNAVLTVTDGSLFPDGCFVRNVRTQEIMYVSGRSRNLNTFVVSSVSRGLRETGAAMGFAGDVIEVVSCLDINVAAYNPTTGAPLISDATLPPSVVFSCPPNTLDDPQYDPLAMAVGDVLTVWMRRTIPAGASQLAKAPLILDFVYEM